MKKKNSPRKMNGRFEWRPRNEIFPASTSSGPRSPICTTRWLVMMRGTTSSST